MREKYLFRQPRVDRRWVLREEVLNDFKREVKSKKRFFISAPGGYGKTVFAVQYMESLNGEKAWIKVDSRNSNSSTFYRHFIEAIASIVPDREFRKAVKNANFDFELATVFEILKKLPDKSKRCYLVIDDLQLASKEVKDSLHLIVKRLPTYITIGFLSREDIDNFIEDEFVIFNKEDLEFSTEDTEELCVKREQVRVKNATCMKMARELVNITKGWVMGIQVLLMSNLSLIDNVIFPENLFDDYFKKYIWDTWDIETQKFLIGCAYLPMVTEENCKFIFGDDVKDSLLKIYNNNIFLTMIDDFTYYFHDLFKLFLINQANKIFTEEELRAVKEKTADWLFKSKDYFGAAKLYMENKQYDKIDLCLFELAKMESVTPLEVHLQFGREIVMNLPNEVVVNNYNILVRRSWYSFMMGDSDLYLSDMEILLENLSEIAATNPGLLEKVIFQSSLNFNVSLKSISKKAVKLLQDLPEEVKYNKKEIYTPTITHKFPYFHRSMRDYSEFYDLNEKDISDIFNSFGKMIGKDTILMVLCLRAGILFEQNNILKAAELALEAYGKLTVSTNYETVFLVNSILIAILRVMKSDFLVERLYIQLGKYVQKKPANALLHNFNAEYVFYKIEKGDVLAAENWLEAYPLIDEKKITFYNLCRSFATLKSYMALKMYSEAVEFGRKLLKFAENYKRDLDQIEVGTLLGICYINMDELDYALKSLKKAVDIAHVYNFSRLFISNGPEIYLLLQYILKEKGVSKEKREFLKNILNSIAEENNLNLIKGNAELTPRRQEILEYISRGLTYAEIAEELKLSYGTVKNHVRLLYRDLEVGNSQEAINKGKLLGIL
ncbi:helix-turn-helix transcriptional regulator [Anaerosphaera multitolerans]|uniref:HTH luxR-type domain-containing protein n=1 Tax=Anaerosphaera multitolerans TaxID=2487351 RepID=A0A437S4L3_9FIRM|nr:LuxR C-terminal-related transcriptional regulator [Anaerosphaera multitolerans]RVU53972.1 hypothetical protein EF514_09660 [Anaerosphaera multitolerans]